VTARRKAHTCTAGAVLTLTTAVIAIPLNTTAALVALAGGILLAACAASYRTEARRAAWAALPTIPYPDPAPMPDWQQAAEQARFDETFADMIRNYDQEAA
jgi:hypothetical protein